MVKTGLIQKARSQQDLEVVRGVAELKSGLGAGGLIQGEKIAGAKTLRCCGVALLFRFSAWAREQKLLRAEVCRVHRCGPDPSDSARPAVGASCTA